MRIFEEVRTVTADGRIIVPWAVQRALGLEHGGSVRFHVENGVVTLVGGDPHRPEVDLGTVGARSGRTDIRRELTAELNALLAVTGRDRTDYAVPEGPRDGAISG
jgi:bifunctional DNA-binding transcriptional regulator/antitoxin component of YhaV-PrlF toxin-antitoxin module